MTQSTSANGAVERSLNWLGGFLVGVPFPDANTRIQYGGAPSNP
jgi:hypothetical protein